MDRRSLFVRAIPPQATNEQLTAFFAQFAPVRHAVIVLDEQKKSRGFGFVSFVTDEDTLTALAAAKTKKFLDRLLRIDIAKRRERKKRGQEGDEDKKAHQTAVKKPSVSAESLALQKTSKVIIRNLPWSVKNGDKIEPLFKKFGLVKDVNVPKKKDGKMCGFAFVTFSKHTSAKRAVEESSDLKIDGREVAVDFAVDKSHWETLKGDEEEEEDDEEAAEEAEVQAQSDDEDENSDDNEEVADENSDAEEDAEEDAEDNAVNSDDEDAKLLELEDTTPKKRANRQERYSIFIRNLPYDVTEESLREHFEKLGEVKYALPVVDKETGLPKGTAFVAFTKNEPYEECLLNCPEVNSHSLLLPDDVSPFYVFEGRIMSIAPAVDRDSALRLQQKSELQRMENLGRLPKEKDRRNLYLLNEGRISPQSKLAQILSQSDMDVRERSFALRAEQLKKNPSLHVSLTRLAIRNIPRAMNDKSLKQLGRKAIVQFATEVKEGKRQPLSKEEIDRSTKAKHTLWEKLGINPEEEKISSKGGVVAQAKVINEVKGSGEYGRSRGYGFLEYRDHKHALMALRWLNAHETTMEEILNGLTDDQKKRAEQEGLLGRKRLVVEFAIENAQVVKRRIEQMTKGRKLAEKNKPEQEQSNDKKRKADDQDQVEEEQPKKKKKGSQKGNKNKGSHVGKKGNKSNSETQNGDNEGEKKELSQNAKFMIGKRRRMRKGGK